MSLILVRLLVLNSTSAKIIGYHTEYTQMKFIIARRRIWLSDYRQVWYEKLFFLFNFLHLSIFLFHIYNLNISFLGRARICYILVFS